METLISSTPIDYTAVSLVYTSGGRHTLGDEAVTGSVFVPKPYRPSQIVALANRILGH